MGLFHLMLQFTLNTRIISTLNSPREMETTRL
nr:MAG TPA: hypothetical protein [Bacteriophage sp.]